MTTYTVHDLAYAKGTTEPVREMLLMLNDKAIKQAALIEELLAALKQGVDETLDYIKRNHLTSAENNHWIVQARAAIAKGEAK